MSLVHLQVLRLFFIADKKLSSQNYVASIINIAAITITLDMMRTALKLFIKECSRVAEWRGINQNMQQ